MAHIHELYDYTASAFILHPTEPKLCLLFHKKLNTWIQPGGHVELNEDPLQCLEHELLEEVGLKPSDYIFINSPNQPRPRNSKTLPLPAHLNVHAFGKSKHKHIDFCYVLKSNTDKLTPQPGESQKINWFTLEEIKKLYEKGKVLDGTFDICSWIFQNHV